MPTVLRFKGYRFFFYSNEGNPREPLHIHVRKGEALAKIWLDPEAYVAESYGMDSFELKNLVAFAAAHREEIRRYWDEHFSN